jgi:cytosine/adenosine deaminase-related metal-dependent hydrolase
VSVITSHSIQGHWGFTNSPEDLHYLGLLNTSIPIVLSHGSFLTDEGLTLLKSTNQYFSVTPESEMHYGHGYGDGYLAMEQAALGVDTHFTYSTDILSQARLWLQTVRSKLYTNVLNTWRLPANNPMSVDQAFLLATRSGGLALHRPDLGIIAPGATADLILWDAETPSMLGWRDPVAAVILHASVENIVDVLVGGQFVKRRGKLVAPGYNNLKTRFLASAERIQNLWVSTPLPVPPEIFPYSGYPITEALTADTLRGYGTGYGETFLTLQT